jgi:hypothetical protein
VRDKLRMLADEDHVTLGICSAGWRIASYTSVT